MSFKLFIYYCALSGGWAALVGWAVGQALAAPLPESWGAGQAFVRAVILGLCLGAMVACALAFVDMLWSTGGRGMSQALLKAIVVAVIGCASGLVGAAVGQAGFQLTQMVLLRVLGWTLTGLLIGGSIGLYDVWAGRSRRQTAAGAVRKVRNGLLGGLLGGTLGGTLHSLLGATLSGFFSAVGALVHSTKSVDDFKSTSAWGFVALGVCIGLFIALAQVILKEAWVRVESGFRAGRELMLTKDEVTIGRAEACDIGLFGDNGIERTHARIVRKNGRFLLDDADTPGGTYLNDARISQPTPLRDGDLIRVGRSSLRFGERAKRK
jgi:hypothetical protein